MLKSASCPLSLAGLKKNLALNQSRAERMALLEDDSGFCHTIQCELLELNRTSLYYKKRPISPEKLAILHEMDAIFTEDPVFGARRIRQELLKKGYAISRPAVANYMKILGLEAIYQKPDTSRTHPTHKIYPYLLRNVKAEYPNHIWGTDITYIRMQGGFMYLVAYLDWFSRYVVSWELSDMHNDDFVIAALERALKTAIPHITNSDQGSQFISNDHTRMLLENGVKVSMDGRGRCMDNIFTERLWRTVKYEDVYIKEYNTPRELRTGMAIFFDKYNNRRGHQSLDYRTPAEVYWNPK
jgi:putative transposase